MEGSPGVNLAILRLQLALEALRKRRCNCCIQTSNAARITSAGFSDNIIWEIFHSIMGLKHKLEIARPFLSENILY